MYGKRLILTTLRPLGDRDIQQAAAELGLKLQGAGPGLEMEILGIDSG